MEANFSTMNTTMPNYGFKILAFAVATVFTIFALNSTFIRISYNKNNLDLVGVHQESEWSGKKGVHSKHKDFLKNGRETRAITTPGTPHVFTAAEQQNLVDWHNDYRRQVSPEASNMEYMTWNDELATWAQEWTDSCYYEHGFPAAAENEKIGQNLWRGFVASLPDGSGPLSSWWDEWQWYDYETNTCLPDKICGHYTQLVWDTSYQVGCGRSFCAEGYDDTLNFTNNYIVACNYREQGNVQGIKPYESGTSCTRCTSGIMTCDDKLCRQCQAGETEAECSTTCGANCRNCATLNADCTCTCQPQFVGVDCSVPCGDLNAQCGVGWPPFLCTTILRGFENVPDDCPAMCGKCTPDDGSFVCDVTTDGVTDATNSLHTTAPSINLTTITPHMETPNNPVTDLALTSVTHGHAPYTPTDHIMITTPSGSSTTLTDPSTAPSDSSTTLRYLISTLNEPITTSDYSSTESSTAMSDWSSHSGSQSDLSTKSHDSSTTQSDLNTPPNDLISTPHDLSTAPRDYLSTTIDYTNTPSHPSSTLIDADTTLFDYSFSLTSIITYTPTISSTTALSTSSTPSTKSPFSAISTVSNVTTAGPDPTTTQSDPTTAASSSSCSSIACNNGGTIDRDDCTCACAEGFQGDDCSTPHAEIRISVVILINVDMITWLQIQDILLDAIAQVTSDYCNTNFSQCCPNYGEKATSGQINFASANDVKIVGGYPKESNVGSGLATETAVYIQPTSMTSSCEEGSSRSAAPESDTMIYIPQDVVLAAINDNIDVIESQLGVPISNVTLGMVDDVQPEGTSTGLSTAWIVGICLLTVIPLIVVAICLLALKMKIYQNQRWWQWHQIQVRSTRVEPIVQPLDQRFTWKQEIDGNPDVYILKNF